MKIECKCHGVSGSCELKTCWRSMPSFREIGRNDSTFVAFLLFLFSITGNILKEKFDSATEVQLKVPTVQPVTKPVAKEPKLEAASMTYSPFASKVWPLFWNIIELICFEPKSGGVRPYLVPINTYFKPQTETDLIYLHSSPDFCERNEKIGSLGTHGRACNRTSKAIDGWFVSKTKVILIFDWILFLVNSCVAVGAIKLEWKGFRRGVTVSSTGVVMSSATSAGKKWRSTLVSELMSSCLVYQWRSVI